jgi:hypothetical protein
MSVQQQYPDGAPVAAAPWDVAGVERPVTRSSSRGESRNGGAPPRDTVPDQAKATVGLLGVTPEGDSNRSREDSGKFAPTIAMNGGEITPTTKPAVSKTPVVANPTRPSAPGGGGGRSSKAGAGGRKIVDPNDSEVKANANNSNLNGKKKAIEQQQQREAVPTVVSSTSSKPMKALYNEMNKACKGHNIKVKTMSNPASEGSLSITCTTQLLSSSPALVFTLEVKRLGDMERMYVLKGSMLKGKVTEFEKVCRVLFSAMKLI